MSAAATLGWFARHEARLAWRDTLMMLRGGRRGRGIGAAIAFVAFILVVHLVAYSVLKAETAKLMHPDKAFFVTLTGSATLAWALLLSQAMESVTRSFYTRADLDLILSSPASAHRLFAVRIAANAAATTIMAAMLVGPVINLAAVLGGARFLFAYGVIAAMGCSAVALAVVATALLFRLAGPKRTRLIAQIVAAVIGAGFVIWVQIIAILSYGSLSRTLVFQSPELIAAMPGFDSLVWAPARAAMGDVGALCALLAATLGLLILAIATTAPAFADTATLVASVPVENGTVGGREEKRFTLRSSAATLRRKEWTLLWRDPWLVSQGLMQILYLVPPAILLWRDMGTDAAGLIVIVPVLVMAAGQLAGGLAWLAISGEDAPDLVATAPVGDAAVLRAKVEAVMVAVAIAIIPVAIAMAFASKMLAVIIVVGAALATAGASAIQFFFRSQAKRSNFRRRQTSSRVATFAEAFLSISIAAAAGLVAGGFWIIALVPLAIAMGVLVASRALAGPQAQAASAGRSSSSSP